MVLLQGPTGWRFFLKQGTPVRTARGVETNQHNRVSLICVSEYPELPRRARIYGS